MLRAIFPLLFLVLTCTQILAQDKQLVSANALNNKIIFHRDSSGLTKFDSTTEARLNSASNPRLKASHPLDTLSPKASHYTTHSLDSIKHGLKHKVDSLNKLKLPTAQYARKLDSLNRIDPLKVVEQKEAKVRMEEQKIFKQGQHPDALPDQQPFHPAPLCHLR